MHQGHLSFTREASEWVLFLVTCICGVRHEVAKNLEATAGLKLCLKLRKSAIGTEFAPASLRSRAMSPTQRLDWLARSGSGRMYLKHSVSIIRAAPGYYSEAEAVQGARTDVLFCFLSWRQPFASFRWEIMDYPPYIGHSDFHVFGPLKKLLAGQRFTCIRGISHFVWDKCLERCVDHVGN